MAYKFKVFWSDKSLDDLESILEYLEKEWTDKEVNNFKNSLSNRIELIGNYPNLFSASLTKPILRRSVLSKQTSIYYHVDSGKLTVTVVRLFDNRMDKDKL